MASAGDRVLHVLDPATGTITNVGIASSGFMVSGEQVAFLVNEQSEGADLNGDGDSTAGPRFDPPADSVLHVFNADTGEVRNLRLATSQILDFDGDMMLFAVSETNHFNADLNADGDTADAVVHFGEIGGPAIDVSIDIRPDDFPNSVNPRSRGNLPVAILTTRVSAGEPSEFDARSVDGASIQFGPAGAAPRSDGHLDDVDGDGDLDLVLHFEIEATGIACGAQSAELRGLTRDGQAIAGGDTVSTVGCK